MEHIKKLHVLYIITKLELGGAQKVCLSLFKGIDSAWLISGTQGPLVREVINNPQVTLLSALEREVGRSELRAFWQLFTEIKKLKRMHPNLIVHTHSTKAGYMGRWAAWLVGVATIIHTVHGFGFHAHQSKFGYFINYLLEAFTSLITTHYICVSSVDITVGIQKIRNFAKKYTLIRAAVNDTQLIPAQKTLTFDGACIFGTVACFKPQKNLFDLLEAFRLVHVYQPETRLEIIGDGVQRPLIETWIKAHHLTAAITLHGWQEHPQTLMRTWDCFVLSSLWEGLPCAVIEARFLQLPVIAYNIGGLHDVIKHGKNGFLCPVKNVQLLAHYMSLIAQNNYLRTDLAQHKDDLSGFTLSSMIEEHKKLYQHISKS